MAGTEHDRRREVGPRPDIFLTHRLSLRDARGPRRCIMKTMLIVVAGVLSIALAAPPGFAQVVDSCGGGGPKPPSNSRAVAAQTVPPATPPRNTLSPAPAQGKKKTIFMAKGRLTRGSGPS